MLVYCAILSDHLVIINVRNADDRCHHMLFFPDSINSLTFHITVTARIRLFFSFASLWFNIVRHLRDNFLFTLINASAWWKTLHKKPNIEFFSPKFTRNTKKKQAEKIDHCWKIDYRHTQKNTALAKRIAQMEQYKTRVWTLHIDRVKNSIANLNEMIYNIETLFSLCNRLICFPFVWTNAIVLNWHQVRIQFAIYKIQTKKSIRFIQFSNHN